jgi:hypothetical protein
MNRGGPCQYDVLLQEQDVEVHATYCPFNDDYWCIHLTIVDYFTGERWNYGWIRNKRGNRIWKGLSKDSPWWVNNLFEIYAEWLLANDFRCQRSIYDF